MKQKAFLSGIFLLSALLSACGNSSKPSQANEASQTTETQQTSNTKDNMNTIHLTKAEFLSKVYDYEANPKQWKFQGDKPAIVDFYATWCGPCKALGPVLEDIAQEYAGKVDIYKVDVDQEQELTQAFGIRSVPTLLFIPVSGEPSMAPGAPSRAQLKEIIDTQLLK